MRRLLPWMLGGGCLMWALVPQAAEGQTSCNFTVSPLMNYGTVVGLPTPQIDVTATIEVTCTNLLSGIVNHRVCLSLPAGTGGTSIADRRMTTSGGHFVQYQLYTNSTRTNVWGAMGDGTPRTVDFTNLSVGVPQTQTVTIYGRLFGAQTGKAVGLYESDLAPVVRRQDYLLIFPPSCQNVTANQSTLSTLTAQLTIDTSCTVDANPLDFGTVNALDGHTATSNLSVACTLNGPYSVALDGGSVSGDVGDRRMQLGPNAIAYQLYRDSGHTQLWGNTPGTVVEDVGTGSPQSIPIYGLVPTQAGVPQGTYQDVVTVTVTF